MSKKLSAKDLVTTKSKALANSAELLAERTNDWQVVRAYLSNRLVEGFQLTPVQEDKMRRYEFAYNQMISHRYTDMEVISQIEKTFKIRRSQALEDLNDAKELYTFLLPLNKAFEIKSMMDGLDKMMVKANALNDSKGYASLMKVRKELLKMAPDVEDNDADAFEPHQNIIEFDPSIIGAEDVDVSAILSYINDKRGIKVNVAMFQEAEVVNEGS